MTRKVEQPDRALYLHLHQENFGAVLKHAQRLGPPRHQEDAVQETFLDLFKRCSNDSIGDIRDVRSWLLQVVHSKMAASYRREQQGLDAQENLARTVTQIETSRTRDLALKEDLRKALLALEPEDVVMLLDQVDGASLAELAEQNDSSINSVRTRIYRTRKQLKDNLGERVLEGESWRDRILG